MTPRRIPGHMQAFYVAAWVFAFTAGVFLVGFAMGAVWQWGYGCGVST